MNDGFLRWMIDIGVIIVAFAIMMEFLPEQPLIALITGPLGVYYAGFLWFEVWDMYRD